MITTTRRGGFIIFLSFVIALILTIMPLPGWTEPLRPYWVMLVIIYWCMATPARVGIGIAWLMGIFVDVSEDALLGQHALAMALIAFFAVSLHQRLRIFPIWQQSVSVFVFSLIYSIIVLWVKGISGQYTNLWLALQPCLTSAIFWPVIFLFLRQIRRHYQIS
jgi:rod shape-determining protein MreD